MNKKLLLLSFLICILCISIGYAGITSKLSFNGVSLINGTTKNISIIANNATVSSSNLSIVVGSSKTVTIIPDDAFTIKSGSCTNGYTITGLQTSPLLYDTQSIVINNNDVYEDSECTFVLEEDPDKVIITNFNYTGNVQTFTAPQTGKYTIELWGAQGGKTQGGYGGYVSGTIELKQNTILYIYVGGKPTSNTSGGYNGGGSTNELGNYAAGGGATDVRIKKGTWNNLSSLMARIMVAAGGGGGAEFNGDIIGGAGGGLNGYNGRGSNGDTTSSFISKGGTQTSGGAGGVGTYASGSAGSFGTGGKGGDFLSGGGSGYYGGGASGVNPDVAGIGAGGSSFISGHNGCNAISSSTSTTPSGQANHYSGYVFSNTLMIDGLGYKWTNLKGSYVGQIQPDGSITTGHIGNGYARITYFEKN